MLRAHCRLPPELRAEPDRDLDAGLEALRRLRSDAYPEPCWGYHFDVETRFFFYPASTPNTIATSFAAHALLDLHERRGGDREALELAAGAGEFLVRRIGATESPEGAHVGYFPGDSTPIHNASLLAASVLARLAPLADRPDHAELAGRCASHALAHQRADGSWPYAEGPAGEWVDGFHTGYVLDALATIAAALGGDERIAAARQRGLDHYERSLFDPDGTPRYFAHRTYPIDSQSVAQAIRSFALAAGEEGAGGAPRSDEWLARAWRSYAFAAARMSRGDGSFIFQRRRLWANRIAHPRWVQGPMLEAMSVLAEAAGALEGR